jgi:hypothetical protein
MLTRRFRIPNPPVVLMLVLLGCMESVAPPADDEKFSLAVSITGSGVVSLMPTGAAGSTCGNPIAGSCNAVFAAGTEVTLTPTPTGTATFLSWGGSCGSSGACAVKMTKDHSVTATFGTATTTPSDGGLIGWYKLDANGTDAAAGAAHASLVGNPSSTANRVGVANAALSLDGASQWIVIPGGTTNGKAAGTINMWLRMPASSTPAKCGRSDQTASPYQCQYNLFAKRAANDALTFRAQLSGSNQGSVSGLYFMMNGSDAITASLGSDKFGSWHMFTFAWDSNGKRVYIDGVLAISGAAATSPSGDLYVGSNSSTGFPTRELLEGAIDDIRIYDHALTAAEVSALFATP